MGNYLLSKAIAALMAGLIIGGPVRAEQVSAVQIAEDRLLVVRSGTREVVFDLATLDSLPQLQFETSTLWTEGVIAFSGPSLRSVLNAAGVAPEA